MSDEGISTLAHLAAVKSLSLAVSALDQCQIGLGVIGPDNLEERIERWRLRSTGTEPGNPLPHLDALLLGTGADSARKARAGFRASTLSFGLGHYQGAARLMRDVASRPRRLGLLDRRPYGRPVIAHSRVPPQQNAILDNELLRAAEVAAHANSPASVPCVQLGRINSVELLDSVELR
jgi:hypothetical protein